jgi:hypothetical protein
MLDKRKVNNEDIFDSDDIGESLRRLFKVSNDNTDNSNENDLKSNKSYTPLIPDSYGELIKEYRENSDKITLRKKFEGENYIGESEKVRDTD